MKNFCVQDDEYLIRAGRRIKLRRAIKMTHPNINFRPHVLFALKDLGRGVGRRAAPRGQQPCRREVVAEAEVGDFDVHVCVEQQIFRLKQHI